MKYFLTVLFNNTNIKIYLIIKNRFFSGSKKDKLYINLTITFMYIIYFSFNFFFLGGVGCRIIYFRWDETLLRIRKLSLF